MPRKTRGGGSSPPRDRFARCCRPVGAPGVRGAPCTAFRSTSRRFDVRRSGLRRFIVDDSCGGSRSKSAAASSSSRQRPATARRPACRLGATLRSARCPGCDSTRTTPPGSASCAISWPRSGSWIASSGRRRHCCSTNSLPKPTIGRSSRRPWHKSSATWRRVPRLVIVLDDFHHAEPVAEVRNFVGRLLNGADTGLTFVIASRRRSAMSLSRLGRWAKSRTCGATTFRFRQERHGTFPRVSIDACSRRISFTRSRSEPRAGPHRFSSWKPRSAAAAPRRRAHS